MRQEGSPDNAWAQRVLEGVARPRPDSWWTSAALSFGRTPRPGWLATRTMASATATAAKSRNQGDESNASISHRRTNDIESHSSGLGGTPMIMRCKVGDFDLLRDLLLDPEWHAN